MKMKKIKSLKVTFSALLIFKLFVLSDGLVHLKLTNIDCIQNDKYFYNHTCRLRAVSRQKSVATLTGFIVDTLRNVTLNLAFFLRNDVNIYRPFLINATENICKWLERKSAGPYVGIFMKLMARFSNVNHSCPYRGKLFANDMYFDTSLVPVPIGLLSFKVKLSFYEGYPLDWVGTITVKLEGVKGSEKK